MKSTKLNGLNVFAYLSHLLTELPKLDENPSFEQLDKLRRGLPGYLSFANGILN